MDNPHEPLLGKTTLNKIIVAAAAGIATALFGWLTVAIIDMRAEGRAVVQRQEEHEQWLHEIETDLGTINGRIDRALEMISRQTLIRELSRDRQEDTGRHGSHRSVFRPNRESIRVAV